MATVYKTDFWPYILVVFLDLVSTHRGSDDPALHVQCKDARWATYDYGRNIRASRGHLKPLADTGLTYGVFPID